MLAMYNIPFRFPPSTLFGIFRFEWYEIFWSKNRECQVETNEHFLHLLLYEFNRGSKLQQPPKTLVPYTKKTLLLEKQLKNGLCASSKVILT
jgi:hypothetical protein